jgi:hypothetical protein
MSMRHSHESLRRRVVDIECRLTVAGVAYEVDAELAGETVVVWWGLFDQELWVEWVIPGWQRAGTWAALRLWCVRGRLSEA